LKKLRYLTEGRSLKNILNQIHPDIIHAHYASSYGAACVSAKIDRYFLSVWGSDIYEFPHSSYFHQYLLSQSLKKASVLLSTSEVMAVEAQKYTSKTFEITPFGVDMNLFSPNRRTRPLNDGRFIIGTVKTLNPIYGIKDILIASNIVVTRRPDIPLEISIAGKGSQEAELKDLCNKLQLTNRTSWLGYIDQNEAASAWANLDLAIIPSRKESFGVAAVEAQACGTPVITSDAPGLLESTIPGVTSVTIRSGDVDQLARCIEQLYDAPQSRAEMGAQGRMYACSRFEYNHCFEHVENLYATELSKRKFE
jgi:glycosyltransferase involved in cell wall biosynthesis